MYLLSYVQVSSIRPHECYWYSFLWSSSPRRTSSEFFTSSLASCIYWSMPLNTLGNMRTLLVSRLRTCRFLQNLRHLLSTARRAGFFPICSSPFAEVAHEKFGLVFCGDVLVASSRTPITPSLSYHESRVEGYSANSPTSAVSSSFVVQCTENGSLFSLQAVSPFGVTRFHQ